MFNRETCKRCNKKASKSFDFCPHCGNPLKKIRKDEWGMLGEDDITPENDLFSNSLMGGFSGKMLNRMIGGAMKMLEREMQREMSQPRVRTNVELYVNGKRIPTENIRITKKPVEVTKETKNIDSIISGESLKRFSELPKQEPSANIRRLSNKVIYELDIPGVTSINDISVIKLENSIEIKAVAKDKAYKKIIPIDLPLKKYKLENEKLILELGVKG